MAILSLHVVLWGKPQFVVGFCLQNTSRIRKLYVISCIHLGAVFSHIYFKLSLHAFTSVLSFQAFISVLSFHVFTSVLSFHTFTSVLSFRAFTSALSCHAFTSVLRFFKVFHSFSGRFQILDFDFFENSFFGTPSSTSDFSDPIWVRDVGFGLFDSL